MYNTGTKSDNGIITEWYESDIVTDRKSRFQGRHVTINSADEIPNILSQLLQQNKNIKKTASHPHIIAWQTGTLVNDNKYINVNQGFQDNGEKGAGSRLLNQVLVNNNIFNVLVIITRWYGGNPIGSSRFRHVVNCGLMSLRKANKI
ncbi:impact [Scheffersomyces amazonensis]|uniref:impact n=1 Tax=Scheffersomyces amazonensis TaxID=1078765 RepID=UPI00315C718E